MGTYLCQCLTGYVPGNVSDPQSQCCKFEFFKGNVQPVILFLACSNGDVRLLNGTKRVEICYNDSYSSICDNHWNAINAGIVCKQLGYSFSSKFDLVLHMLQFTDILVSAIYIAAAIPLSGLSHGEGGALLANVNCVGDESDLLSCDHDGVGQRSCGPFGAAGVMCRGIQHAVDQIGPSESCFG